MEAGIKIGLHNKFDIEVRDAKTNELKQSVTAYNIVLDAIWSRLVNRQSFMGAIHIGTGTGTLAPSRTALFTFLVGRNVTLDSTSYNINNMYRRVKIQLEPSEFVGSTITEVGVAYGTTNTNLVTHAMLTDAEGNPISILKTDTNVVIIYATVFFTVGELPSYVKLTGINWNGNVSGNQTLARLINQTGSIETNIRVGTYGDFDNITTGMLPNVRGTEITTKTADLTTDVANKKINFPIRRFEIAEANGHIQEFGIGGSFNIRIPNENYTGTQYDDIILTGQDGSKTVFVLPSANIDETTIVVKVNNIETEVILVGLPYYRLYKQTGSVGTRPFFKFMSDEFFTQMSPSDSAQTLYNYGWVDGQFKQISATQIGGSTPSYTDVAQESSLAFVYASDTNTLVVADRTTLDVKLTSSYSYYDSIAMFIEENIFLSNTVITNYPRYTQLLFLYTLDEGITWIRKAVGSSFEITNGYNADRIVASQVNKILFQGKANAGTNVFRLLSYDVDLMTITPVTVPTATQNPFGAFSQDGSLLATFGNLSGVNTFEKVSDVWTLTNIFPDSSPIVYTYGWFINNNTFVACDEDRSIFSVWVKVSGAWEKALNNVSRGLVVESSAPKKADYKLCSFSGLHMPGGGDGAYINKCTFSKYAVKFDTPPGVEDEIKVSYKVNGIHKTTNYVLDVSGYIQFGEG